MVDKETQQTQSINEKLAGPFKFKVIDVRELEFLEKNARYMKNEQYQNLVENIKKDGALASVPFCYLTEEGKYRILSGNHRSRAAIDAGLKEIPILYTDEELTKEEQISIQLSHNAITGQDDPIILQELYDEIEDINLKYYSGLDDKVLEQLENVTIDGISEAQLDYLMLSFLFLPEEVERVSEVFNKAKDMINSDTILARYKEYDRLLDAQEKTQLSYNVHNGATSLMIILDVFENHLDDLQEGYRNEDGEPKHNKNVPISTVLGTEGVPSSTANTLIKVMDKMVSRSEIDNNNKYEVIDLLCELYLEGDN